MEMNINWKSTALIAMLIMLIGLGILGVLACIPFSKVETHAESVQDPASVCAYEVSFISIAQCKTLEDFWAKVGHTIEWLSNNGYEIIDLKPKYGKDITQKEVLKFVYIKYFKKEKK